MVDRVFWNIDYVDLMQKLQDHADKLRSLAQTLESSFEGLGWTNEGFESSVHGPQEPQQAELSKIVGIRFFPPAPSEEGARAHLSWHN